MQVRSSILRIVMASTVLLFIVGCSSTTSGRYYEGPRIDRSFDIPAVDSIYVENYVEGFITTTGASYTKVRLRGPEELVDSFAVIERGGTLYIRPQTAVYSAEPLEITVKLPGNLSSLQVNDNSLMRINPEVTVANSLDLQAEDNSAITAEDLRSSNMLTLTAYDNSSILLTRPKSTNDIFANADDYSTIRYQSLRDLNSWQAIASLHSNIVLRANSVFDSILEARSSSRVNTQEAPSTTVSASAYTNAYISVKGTSVTTDTDATGQVEEF